MVKTRVVFLGTPDFAVPSLRALLSCREMEVVGVLTQPDRPAGRGLKLTPPPVKLVALEHRVRVLQPARIRGSADAIEFLKEGGPDLGVVAAFGQILPEDFFNFPRFGMLNVHASLLPRYRGAAPIAHAIWHGETRTGVTIMKLDAGMDSGDMLLAREVPIGSDTTAGELSSELAQLGAEVLMEVIPRYLGGTILPSPQDHSRATFAPRLKKEQGLINWNLPARDVHNQIRALNPFPGAFTHLRGQRLKIWRSCLDPETHEKSEPGFVIPPIGPRIRVGCGGREAIVLREVQSPGRKRVRALDFARGCALKAGEAFS